MSTVTPDAPATRLTPLHWLIIVISAIGFAFDSYVLLMLPLIVRPALSELLQVPPTSPLVNDWANPWAGIVGGLVGMGAGFTASRARR